MAINYTQLRTELQTDPNGYGYGPLALLGNDQGLADMLNLHRSTIRVRRADIAPSEVLEAIDTRDLTSNTNTISAAWFESITQQQSIRLLNDDGSDTRAIANFVRMSTNTNGTQTRLRALAERDGSRAEQLFGTGVLLSHPDISTALRG